MDASLAASLLLAHATNLLRAGDYDRAHPLILAASNTWSVADDEREQVVRGELLTAGLREAEIERRIPRLLTPQAEGSPSTAVLPFVPYFGSKWDIAPLIWSRLGNVPNFLDAFTGGSSIAFRRPHVGKVETLNDLFGFIPNALRALRWAPEAVATECSWIGVSELDLHARHASLVERCDDVFIGRLRRDPTFYDVEMAAWWIWGQSQWIGSEFCSKAIEGKARGTMPHLQGSDGTGVGYGRGIFASGRRENLRAYFSAIQARLGGDRAHNVRITCHDALALLSPAVTTSHGLTGVVLDPPYGRGTSRDRRLYGCESAEIAAKVAQWAVANGGNPHLRIVLCGYEDEHTMPASWECVAWKAKGGYGNQGGENANASRERLWFSPHCLNAQNHQGPLFDRLYLPDNVILR